MGSLTTLHGDSQQVTILLFGPQIQSSNKESLEILRRTLSETPIRNWILETVADLLTYWHALTNKIPKIASTVPGDRFLTELNSWLENDLDEGKELIDLPNMVLTPLVVIIQLTQYWRYLGLNRIGDGNGTDTFDLQAEFLARQTLGTNKVETLGFCTGLLSAFTVASSHTKVEFKKYGAVAVRLAMLVSSISE